MLDGRNSPYGTSKLVGSEFAFACYHYCFETFVKSRGSKPSRETAHSILVPLCFSGCDKQNVRNFGLLTGPDTVRCSESAEPSLSPSRIRPRHRTRPRRLPERTHASPVSLLNRPQILLHKACSCACERLHKYVQQEIPIDARDARTGGLWSLQSNPSTRTQRVLTFGAPTSQAPLNNAIAAFAALPEPAA
jgi:hypothetical protein